MEANPGLGIPVFWAWGVGEVLPVVPNCKPFAFFLEINEPLGIAAVVPYLHHLSPSTFLMV